MSGRAPYVLLAQPLSLRREFSTASDRRSRAWMFNEEHSLTGEVRGPI